MITAEQILEGVGIKKGTQEYSFLYETATDIARDKTEFPDKYEEIKITQRFLFNTYINERLGEQIIITLPKENIKVDNFTIQRSIETILQRVAQKLSASKTTAISFEEVQKMFPRSPELAQTLLRTCPLIKTDSDQYEFEFSSVRDYFVAEGLAKSLLKNNISHTISGPKGTIQDGDKEETAESKAQNNHC